MLRTQTTPQVQAAPFIRWSGIVSFTVITALSARVTVEFGTLVPFTLQVLAVLMAGIVLGRRDGALSQIGYIGLLLMNLPVDARMLGMAALVSPTAGFIWGFPVVAYMVGWLTENGAKRPALRWLAAIAGISVLYMFGAGWLKVVAGFDWPTTLKVAVQPFILLDMLKAIIAVALGESARWLFFRQS